MKKHILIPLCFLLSGIFFLVFLIKTIADYSHYTAALNSAPFYIWIVVNAVYFIVPAFFSLVLGLLLQKRKQDKLNTDDL